MYIVEINVAMFQICSKLVSGFSCTKTKKLQLELNKNINKFVPNSSVLGMRASSGDAARYVRHRERRRC